MAGAFKHGRWGQAWNAGFQEPGFIDVLEQINAAACVVFSRILSVSCWERTPAERLGIRLRHPFRQLIIRSKMLTTALQSSKQRTAHIRGAYDHLCAAGARADEPLAWNMALFYLFIVNLILSGMMACYCWRGCLIWGGGGGGGYFWKDF